jgi:predicted MFS family arabinose efflux permease
MQNFGSNLLGSFVAPVALVWLAQELGWQNAFFIAGVPGLICALLIWLYVKEPVRPAAPAAAESFFAHVGTIAFERNIMLCVLMSILLVSYLVICWAFMPLFLTKVRGFDPGTMSWLMATLGISATLGSFGVSYLSDVIGRKPVMIVTSFLGVILPLGAMYFTGSPWTLAVILFFGWALTGIFPLFMATVPSESVDARHMTTAMALVMGMGEVVGGVLSPSAAGWAADLAGLSAPLWIMMGLCTVSGVLALGLRETAPAALRRRQRA